MTMNWFTRSRQRYLGLLAALALVFALTLSACGSPANAANSGAPASKPSSGTQQYQPSSNTQSSNKATNTDQQIQSLLRQLDGAHNDVNNADSGTSQDGGQP
jgi:hypothetical protein